MECGSCDARIREAVSGIKGIRRVKVDPEQNTIEVTYTPAKAGVDDIRRAIAGAGFRADELRPSAAGYSSLDACCKRPRP